jgi:major membrane immunogen (membrane-anchored lipoprotein)
MKCFSVAGFAFSLIGLQFLAGCSSKTFPSGNYQESPVTVDGDLGEWSQPLRFSSKSGQVQYTVTNYNKNVYIFLQTHDDATAL